MPKEGVMRITEVRVLIEDMVEDMTEITIEVTDEVSIEGNPTIKEEVFITT